jgi:hypothetical protein
LIRGCLVVCNRWFQGGFAFTEQLDNDLGETGGCFCSWSVDQRYQGEGFLWRLVTGDAVGGTIKSINKEI